MKQLAPLDLLESMNLLVPPDPKPPESIVRPPITDVAKPDGRLPQTNVIGDPMLIWLGVLLISTVFFLGKRQKNQTTQR